MPPSLIFDCLPLSFRRPHSSPRSLYAYFSRPITTPTRWPLRRAFSIPAFPNDLFDYTSGRWLINDALRHAERRRVFNVPALCQLAAESVGRTLDDVVNFTKLAEGACNRTFLVTMRDDFQMVARIPYPATVPKRFAVASEVATMDLLRSCGLPVPQVYGYSPLQDNVAETEYILMEFVRGNRLSAVWPSLGESELDSVLREVVQLESRMMAIDFPAGGSLYYPKDLEKIGGGPGIPFEDGRFCVGPDTRLPLWYGRRSQLDVHRGPYESAEAALVTGTHKELAYLERFGQPLLPFQPLRRESYGYQAQSPLHHIQNLHRYLLIASSLVPKDPVLCHFRIRHPDLQWGNIIVSKSPNSEKWQIAGVLDWQHTSVLPLFLLAGVPDTLQNSDDPISQPMPQPPLLPEDFDDLDGAMELYRRRLVHYFYVKNTEAYNGPHYTALTDAVGTLRRRLFYYASDPWEGETLALKVALIEAVSYWEMLAGGGVPCPVVFDAEDVRETMRLSEAQREADGLLETFENVIGFGPEGWVSFGHYERAVVLGEQVKEAALKAAESAEERDEIREHWFLDDVDEEKYM